MNFKEKNRLLRRVLSVGDVVYSANNGKPMRVLEFDDDGFFTEEDYFFADEVGKLFFLTKIGYENRFSEG